MRASPTRLLSILATLLVLTMAGINSAAWAQKYGRPAVAQNPNLLRQQAFDSYLAGDFDDAALLYKQAINAGASTYGKNSSFVADLFYELGTMGLEEGNYARAQKYLPQAVRMKPNSVQARVKLADLYLRQDKLDEAMGQIGTALKRNPGSVEAQKELVKLMMARAKKDGENSEAANLACTWESFQLKNFSNNLVKSTNTLIAQWKKQLNSANKRIPTLSIAMSSPTITRTQAAPPPKPAKIKPPQNTSTKSIKSRAKKSKPTTHSKAKTKTSKPKPKPVRVEKPKPKKVSKPVVARKRPKRSNGLVPPPPPTVPVPAYNAPPPSSVKLEAKAQLKDKKKEKKPIPKKKVKKKKPKQTIPDEPDFILDWASKKK